MSKSKPPTVRWTVYATGNLHSMDSVRGEGESPEEARVDLVEKIARYIAQSEESLQDLDSMLTAIQESYGK